VWLTEGTWEACVDAARELGGEVTLLHVVDVDTAAALSGPTGLLGRAGSDGAAMLARAEDELIRAAVDRLGRAAGTIKTSGRPEREVVAACVGFDLLVLARDGDRSRLGPRSLGHATRFVVDHTPCKIFLVWPEASPGLSTIPPPPNHDQMR
jgi:nucleotide-binding universal stress UspA family protein